MNYFKVKMIKYGVHKWRHYVIIWQTNTIPVSSGATLQQVHNQNETI